MIVKNDYSECLTNLACSIRRYFELKSKHNSLSYIDSILDDNKPKNVIVILFDGMGSKILKRNLDNDNFFIKNMYKEITTVFPATTTAATTSIRTGLNPVEHGWLGWNTYLYPIDKTITLFLEKEMGKKEKSQEFLQMKDMLVTKQIVDEIIEEGKYEAINIFPFMVNNSITYNNLDEMFEMILNESKTGGRKYIYAYDEEPDHSMHEFGPDSDIVKNMIIERSKKVEELCSKLDDSLVIVVADHGHIKVDNYYIDDYPELTCLLERPISIEQRTISFKIKEGYQQLFVERFNNIFEKFFKLFSKEEIIKSKLFGEGDENPLFKEAIGDFIAIAYDSNKCILTKDSHVFVSQHAGYTDDEIYVPLIKILKK